MDPKFGAVAEVHVSQINTRKKLPLAEAPEVFSRKPERAAVEHEAERERLFQKIGHLQVEVDWLKKTNTYCQFFLYRMV